MTDMDISQGNGVQLYPPWREGYKRFVAAWGKGAFKYGDLVRHEWWSTAMDLSWPDIQSMTALEFEKAKKKYYEAIARIAEALMEEHRIFIENVSGKGYVILLPGEQAAFTERCLIDDWGRASEKARIRSHNMDVDGMTAAERRAASTAVVRISKITSMQERHAKHEALMAPPKKPRQIE